MSNKHICLFHRNCNDGLCAAAILNMYLGDDVNKSFIACNYNDVYEFDVSLIDNETTVWILDFSFPMDKMRKINDAAQKVYWFDHHMTPINSLYDKTLLSNTIMVLDVNRSGAGITWDTLYKTPRPQIVNVVEDRDLWKFQYKDTRVLCEAFSVMARTPQDPIFKKLFVDNIETLDSMLLIGNALRSSIKHKIDMAIANGFYGRIHGHLAFFVNATDNISEIGEAIYKSHSEPIVACIYRYVKHDQIVFSLRSNQIDVEQIAKKHGGGGHVGAAGFMIPAYWDKTNKMLENDTVER